MASGDLLADWTAADYEGAVIIGNMVGFATTNAQGSWAFDDTAVESAFVSGLFPPPYSGGGVTLMLIWTSATATSGGCVWTAQMQAQPVGEPIGSNGFAGAQTVTATAPGTAGNLVYTPIAFTHGAQMDSLAVGERFRVVVGRVSDNGSDTMTGDAWLVAVRLTET